MDKQEFVKMQELHNTYWWFKGKKEIILHLIRKYHPEAKNLLDIGCGEGYFFDHYPGIGIEPYSPTKRDHIIKKPIEAVSLDEKFDVILCLDVLEHLRDDTIIKKYIDNNLKENGIAIITVPAHRKLFNQHDTAHHHFRRYDKADLLQLLHVYQPKVYYYNSLLYPIAYAMRKLTKGKDNLKPLPWLINETLFTIFRLEKYVYRYLLNGMSLLAVIQKPA